MLHTVKSYVMLALVAFPTTLAAAPTPPDLAVGWVDTGAVVTGEAGQTAEIRYFIRNNGGRDAFAVITRVATTLGPIPPARIQPGPAAGKSVERKVSLALATGMNEVCVEVNLQNVAIDDAPDPNLANNKVCRRVDVREPKK